MGQHHQSLKKIAYFLFAFAAVAYRSHANPVSVSYLDIYPTAGISAYGVLNFDPSDLAEGALPGSYMDFTGSISDFFFIPAGAPVSLSANNFPLVNLFYLDSANRVGTGGAGQGLYDQLTTDTGTIAGEQLLDVNGPNIFPIIPAASGFWYGYIPPAPVPDGTVCGGLLFGSLAILAAAKRRLNSNSV